MFYAYPQINWLTDVSRSLVNKQGRRDEVWLAPGRLDPSRALSGTLVLVCSASIFSFLSLTLLVQKQKFISQVFTEDLQTLFRSSSRSPAGAAPLRKEETGLT